MSTGFRPLIKRINGFQLPHSNHQIAIFVIYPITTAAFYVLSIAVLKTVDLMLTMIIESVLVVSCFVFWILVETINPEDNAGKSSCSVLCFPHAGKTSHYCGTCKKYVLGMDHHCTWLNTCVGIRNYIPFISLTCCGLAQFAFQTIIGVLIQTYWLEGTARFRILIAFQQNMWIFQVLASLHTTVAATLFIAFSGLAGFHIFLMLFVHLGTYDWLLHGRGSTASPDNSGRFRKNEMLEAKKQRERNEWQQVMVARQQHSHTGGGDINDNCSSNGSKRYGLEKGLEVIEEYDCDDPSVLEDETPFPSEQVETSEVCVHNPDIATHLGNDDVDDRIVEIEMGLHQHNNGNCVTSTANSIKEELSWRRTTNNNTIPGNSVRSANTPNSRNGSFGSKRIVFAQSSDDGDYSGVFA